MNYISVCDKLFFPGDLIPTTVGIFIVFFAEEAEFITLLPTGITQHWAADTKYTILRLPDAPASIILPDYTLSSQELLSE